MKAVQIESYGDPLEVLEVVDVSEPGPPAPTRHCSALRSPRSTKGIAQHQKRPVALYAEGIKWLNWAVEMLEGKKTEFHGVQVPRKENNHGK
jgi:hypothetical protein